MAKTKTDMALRLIEARKSAGFKSQDSIAAQLGVTREAYAKYEIDRPFPSEKLGEFCHLTNVNAWWLLTGKGSRHPIKDIPDWIVPYLSHLNTASPEMAELIISNIEMLRKLEANKGTIQQVDDLISKG